MLVLRIAEEKLSGGWIVQLHELGRRAAPSRLDAAAVAEIRREIAALLAPTLVCIEGQDLARREDELRVGQVLARVWSSIPQVAVQSAARERARSAGQAPVLVVETEGERVSALPWELLSWAADGLPVEDGSGAVVVRLAEGTALATRPPGEDLRVLLWCPTPEDPACKLAIDAIQAELGDAVVRVEDPNDAPPPAPRRADLLHVVCHGKALDGAGELLFGDAVRGSGEVGAVLAALLPRVSGVTLEVCSGAAPGPEVLRSLAGRLLASGAAFCVAPSAIVSAPASVAFARAFVRSLRAGSGLAAAVAQGRGALRLLADPDPDSRPSRVLFFVTDATVMEELRLVEGEVLPGWGRVGTELRGLVQRAAVLARQGGLSWVGVEHLLAALRPDEGSARARSMARAIPRPDHELWARLGRVWVEPGAPLQPTPRLRALAEALPDGAGLEALWAALVADGSCGVHALGTGDLRALFTRDPSKTGGAPVAPLPLPQPATAFVVVWGPEDGRVLRPEPGQAIGRHKLGSTTELRLFERGDAWDQQVSGRHLVFRGPGRVHAEREVRRVRAGGPLDGLPAESGELGVAAGEWIVLGDATWLLGVSDNSAQRGDVAPLG